MGYNSDSEAFAPAGAAPAAQIDLRIIATSDLHVALMPYDYLRGRPRGDAGLVRLAPLIARLRAEAPNALVVDNGDFLQGSPMGDFAADRRAAGLRRPHPMIAAMNAIGYDAVGLGNHEFNYGLDFLADSLADARFPVLASNLAPLGNLGVPWLPHVVLPRSAVDSAGGRHPLAIGVLALLPPQVMVWDEAWLAGRLWAEGIVEAAHRTVDALRAAGADVVVALCHSGLGPAGAAAADPEAENAALAVAAIGGIDAVVAGHTHEVFPSADLAGRAGCDTEAGRLAGRPATMPGWEGSHVGVIDLTLERGQGGRWRAAGGRGRVVACAAGGGPTGAAGRAVADIIAADHSALCRRMRRPMGATGTTISTRFALAGDSSAAGLIARACRAEAARMVAGTALEGVPVLGASAPFRCGGRAGPDSFTHIPPGPLRLRHLCELSPYPNRLDILRLTGAGLRAWLEHAAGLFATLAPGGQDQPLTEPATPAYLFDVIDGLTYRIDPSAPPRHGGPGPAGDGPGRIRDLCHEGRPVRDDAVFLLATSSYRVSGGGGFPGTGPGRSVMRSDMTVRDILARHLRRLAGPVQAAPPIWRFVPLPGTTAILTTAPGAAEGLPAGAQALGLDERGFLRVRLAL